MTIRRIRNGVLIALIVLAFSVTSAQDATPEVTPTMQMELPDRVPLVRAGLFPEGVEWDALNNRFYVSSLQDGTVYMVMDDGTHSAFINDERIPVSLGLEADEERNRLLVAATDQQREGYLGVYDLTTGADLLWVDFAPLLPDDPEHFINDVTVDGDGNAYVTDSFAGVIYRVDTAGNAEVFLEDETFSTDFALNGIVYHAPSDSLLAVRLPDVIQIPLANPTDFARVQVDAQFIGADGLVLLDDQTLVVVTNNPAQVYRLASGDDFASAQVTGMFDPGDVFPTTVAARDGEAYVLYAQLNAQQEPREEFPIVRAEFEDTGAMMDDAATPEATPGT